MKKLLLLLFFPVYLFGQDVHLSQFYTNQQNLNPALTGNYEGLYRVSSNYRNQWRQIGGTPIVTSIITFDHKFYFNSDVITGGILVSNDQFSDFGLQTTKIQAGASYQKKLRGHDLKGGVQVGYVMKQTDAAIQSYPSQWVYEQGDFNTSVLSGENNLNEIANYLTTNIGFAWSKRFARYTPTAGFAIYQFNAPNNSFFDDNNSTLKSLKVFHAEVLKLINSTYSIEPKLAYLYSSKAQNLVFGGNVYKKLNNKTILQVQAGVLYRDGFGRNSDAIIPVIGLQYKNFDFGLSYDYNVGQLSEFSYGKGTYELSLVYTLPAFLPEKLTLPCERY